MSEYPPENSATTGAIEFLSGDAGEAAGSESTQNPPARTFRSFEAEAQWLKLKRCPSSSTRRTGFGLGAQMTPCQRRKLLTHELSRGWIARSLSAAAIETRLSAPERCRAAGRRLRATVLFVTAG